MLLANEYPDTQLEDSPTPTVNHQQHFTELFNCYRAEIYNTAIRITKCEFMAEDIVNDVFLKIWVKREELHKIEQLSSYLFIMTRNLIFDKLRKKRNELVIKEKLFKNHNGTTDMEEFLADRQLRLLLHKAILQMPAKQQKVYRLVKEHGLSHGMAAHVLSVSPLTIKKHIANSLKFIRCYLEEKGMLR